MTVALPNILGTNADDMLDASLLGARKIFGRDGNDYILGGAFADVIFGGAGNDRIFGNGGDDKIFSGLGRDFVDGGAGNDSIWLGNDATTHSVAYGQDGNDFIQAGKGSAGIQGGHGSDLLRGGVSSDFIIGGAIQPNYDKFLDIGTIDSIDGGAGDDNVFGGYGNDLVFGGTGDDRIGGDLGNDRLKGGTGIDTFVYRTVENSAPEAGISNIDRIVDFESGIDKLIILGAIDTDFTISDIAGGLFIDGTGNNDLYVYGLTTDSVLENDVNISGHSITVNSSSYSATITPNAFDDSATYGVSVSLFGGNISVSRGTLTVS